MKIATTQERTTLKVISWLQILLGVLVLSVATYRFINDDYSFKSVKKGITIMFGFVLPALAVVRLVCIHKQKREVAKHEEWQEPETL